MKALRESVGSQLATRGGVYEMMIRRDYFLPDSRRAIASLEFLDGVFVGAVYLPKQSDVHPVQRTATPTKKDCRLILLDILGRC